ncbi:hypothetical protein AUJ65_05990 [Candidatus Micrarchaeota archaeon CG1_02_51_15]|nr:MAG: hypothetical protein AUJ65_05990 [Candidatus Micrarchaeota archaeon CG1_02_51_15]
MTLDKLTRFGTAGIILKNEAVNLSEMTHADVDHVRTRFGVVVNRITGKVTEIVPTNHSGNFRFCTA